MVIVNGKEEAIAGSNLKEYLETSGYDINRIVVEVNLSIISKEELDSIIIKDEDTIEVLSFVGGG